MNEQVREEQIEVNQDMLWNSNRQLGSSHALRSLAQGAVHSRIIDTRENVNSAENVDGD